MRRVAFFLILLAFLHTAAGGEGGSGAVFPELEAILSIGDVAPQTERQRYIPDLTPEVRVRVTSPRHTVLSSQVSGRVDKVRVRDGERFEANQPLVEIDPTFETIQLERSRANYRRQELMLEMVRELVELQTKGELELELARADLAQAAAEVKYIEARLGRMRVAVPFAGRVGEVAVKELQVVAEGQPLLEIIDDSEMELEFIVSSLWLRWFTPGFAFTVHIDEVDRTYDAELVRVGGKVDPLSKSVNAYARLKVHDPALMEGMSGEAFITQPPETEP